MKRAAVAILLCLAGTASAHEIRPAYLEVREESAGRYQVLWKTPMRGDMRLSLEPEFSGRTRAISPVTVRQANDASVLRWQMEALDPLRGQTITINGLEGTMTDAVVRIEFADATTWTQRLTPWQPHAVIPAHDSMLSTAGTYLRFGVEHILLGIDHLLFVVALLLITHGGWKLVKTITAFTLAHSLTLGLATLGFVHVPQQPVEAVIALSIVFVAAEIVRSHRGRYTIASRAPWIVAFTFGLLHGFGFAGALTEIGLPETQIPVALLFFNIGVEAGQLLFVAAVLAGIHAMRRIPVPVPTLTAETPAYVLGTVAMFWVIQRVAGFWSG